VSNATGLQLLNLQGKGHLQALAVGVRRVLPNGLDAWKRVNKGERSGGRRGRRSTIAEESVVNEGAI
jgi:hypothetical protein